MMTPEQEFDARLRHQRAAELADRQLLKGIAGWLAVLALYALATTAYPIPCLLAAPFLLAALLDSP